jgi:anti-sigma regulatory factor (Ser/Thr protein kinase)
MEELSLHILDIVENSIAAGARWVRIRVREDRPANVLRVEIADNGRGMSAAERHQALDPFFTTRTTRRVGLGLALFEQAAHAAGGEVTIESRPGAGTTVTATFQYDHLDRQPLGDMAGTLLSLAAGHPEVEFSYSHWSAGGEIRFSTREVTAQLGDAPLESPQGIAALRRSLERVREHAASG